MSNTTPVKEMSLFQITWPLVLTFALGLVMPVIDSFFLSRVSDLAAGAVGALIPVIMTLTVVTMFFTQAGVSVGSQFLGGEKPRHARAAYLVTGLLGLGIGAVISIGLFLVAPDLGSWLGLSAEGNRFAALYLGVYGPLFVLKGMHTYFIQVIASKGHTFLNLVGVAVMNACNIGLNYVFYEGLFGAPRLGVQGVALATVLSMGVNILFSVVVLRWRLRFSLFDGVTKRLAAEVLRPVVRIGVPSIVEPASYQLYQVAIISLVVSLGAFSLTTRVYAGNLVLFTVITSLGIGTGAQILIAHLVGAHQFDRANRQLHLALFYAVGLTTTMVAIIWFLAPALLGLFTKNRDIILFGQSLIVFEFIGAPARAFNIIITNALRCSGDARTPSIIGTALMWTVGLGGAVLLGFTLDHGLWGIWAALAVDELTRATFNYLRWRQGIWRDTCVIR